MFKRAFTVTKTLFGGDLEIHPVKLTIVQSVLVTVFASIFAVVMWELIGVHYHSIWYQLFVTLVCASILAPIFLYPTFKTSGRLREANAIIEMQVVTDHLTGLPNNFALAQKLETSLQNIAESEPFALHFMDLDRFKQINDSLGHDAGNALLIEVAARLQDWIDTSGFVARYGGDEFVVIQHAVSNERDAARFAMDMIRVISERCYSGDQELSVGATVGTAMAPLHSTEQAQLLKAADLALYDAKRTGKAHRLFEAGLENKALTRRKVESALRAAMRNGRLKAHFHSIVELDNPLRIVGFEALARIELPDGELLFPDEFIPVAESTGLILGLGEDMLRQACRECARWHPETYVAVNVSPVQLARSDFVATVVSALEDSSLAPGRLELEVTESVLISDIANIGSALERLRAMGVRIALDDFGSGFCGLHYLRQITIDKIKIDKSIVDDAGSVRIAANILRSVADIAREMEITLTAEGVDTIEKAELLARENCSWEVQGYLFSKPVPAAMAYRMQEFMGHRRADTNMVVLSEYAKEHSAG